MFSLSLSFGISLHEVAHCIFALQLQNLATVAVKFYSCSTLMEMQHLDQYNLVNMLGLLLYLEDLL